ncbi:ABC transporter permease [Naasia lichenicola]|uniref:ABC transporter permease n=1 Tax=Naasia lichenicola TaxID=2565933 RepID=A0A4V3WTG8_9MICO|nr:ABC transporter permease [Naasia lichenicola]THG30650.1 ABC transporter permease [Naasia lichenicola]THG31887.1 ABC transporter permease [Naasia lichenicola]
MSNATPTTANRAPAPTPWKRIPVVGLLMAVIVGVLVLAFSWPGVTSEVKDLPVAIVGPDVQVEAFTAAVDENQPGVLDLRTADDEAEARELIETRAVYGAIVLGKEPEVLTTSAGSAVVSQLLTGIAGSIQAQANAAAQAQAAASGAQAPVISVAVTDVVPLADTDPRGVGLAAASFPMVIGGMIGGIGLTLAVAGVARRLVALAIYVIAAGAVAGGILQGWLGILQGDVLVNMAALALAFLSIGGTIVGVAALVGRAGIAIGPVLFLLIGNPISSSNSPVQFLPEPWGAVGQYLPPGAGATLLRDLSYFPKADTAFPWTVLAVWAAAGVLLALVGHFRSRRYAVVESIA